MRLRIYAVLLLVAIWVLITPAALIASFFIRDPKKRGWLFAAALFGLVPYVCGFYARFIEPNTLTIQREEIVSAAWREKPLRIGVISDPHIGGPSVPAARMQKIVARMNVEKPDIVVLLGDYPYKRHAERWRRPDEKVEIEKGIAAFAGLKAPLGVYGVIGNNDTRYGAERMRSFLERANVTVLQNASAMAPGGGFYIAGLDDLQAHHADLAKALAAVPTDASAIVITHIPDSFAEMPSNIALTLAGHSHCGQIGLPLAFKFVSASEGSKVWRCHLYEEGGRYLYVSGGIGTSVLPMRFMAPPEINILTLRGAGQ